MMIESIPEETEDTNLLLFRSFQERGVRVPWIMIADARSSLVLAIRKRYAGES